MKKRFAFCCVLLAVLLGITWLSCGLAEEFEPLRVYVHDALTMKYEVVGGSGQYEVVSTSLTDSSGAAVSPSEFKNYSYYYATVTVRDLVTGETATDTSGTQYKDPNTYSCEEGRHTAYGSEDAGDLSEKTEWVNVEYLNITETEHTVHYTTAYRCIYCYAYMFSKESSVVETHYFNRDTGYCKCGKYDATLVCAHSEINDDDFYIHSYEIVDDNKHIEVLYKKLFCEDCGYDLGTEFWKEQTVSHFFFTGDDKCKCGYRKAPECRHIRTEETFIGTSYTPSETDLGIHWAEPNYKVTCLDCGYVRNQTWEGMPEHHEYDENGKCVCGVTISVEDCLHEHTEQRNGATRYIPVEGDLKNHTVEHIYDTYCLNCNRVLSTLQDSWAEAHEFNQEGLCALCGYQVDPDTIIEPLKVSLSAWQKRAVVNTSIGVTATINGGSGDFRYQWSASSVQGKHAQSNSANASWAITPKTADTWSFSLTLHDNVTGETVTAYSGSTVVLSECQHIIENPDDGKTDGISSMVRQTEPILEGDETGHGLAYVYICFICSERITTAWSEDKDPHTFTSDDMGKLTCTDCQYSVVPGSFAEAANIVGSPAYRIYHNAVFPLHSADGLFRSTASSVIEHRVNDKFLVYLEEAYDVLDNEDFEDTENAMKEQIVYETLQDLLCERADETMADAIEINQSIDNNESVIEEVGHFVEGEAINLVWDLNKLNGMEKAYLNFRIEPVRQVISFLAGSGEIINATQEELAKISFCLAMAEETDRALHIMREEMSSSYTKIIDDLIEQNEKGLKAAVTSQYIDAAGLIAELGAEAIIDYTAFTVVPGIIDTIAEVSHQSYLSAFRAGKSVAEVTSQMRTTAMWNQVSQGANIAGSIIAGIKIGHAIGGAADQLIYAQDQLVLILPHEMTAYSNMNNAYSAQSPNLYEVTCIYLQTLKQGYSSAKAMYDSHDTAFAKLWESAEETEACISLSKECQSKMNRIDNYLQLLNVERDKYEK